MFKPNNDVFPFTIDIKDKTTGEAVIEVIRKEINQASDSSSSSSSSSGDQDEAANKEGKLLDCNKRKDFKFLIQAHDCSSPSLSSNK